MHSEEQNVGNKVNSDIDAANAIKDGPISPNVSLTLEGGIRRRCASCVYLQRWTRSVLTLAIPKFLPSVSSSFDLFDTVSESRLLCVRVDPEIDILSWREEIQYWSSERGEVV